MPGDYASATDRQIHYLGEQLTKVEESMIDPRDFGRLEGEVKALQGQIGDLTTKIDELMALANKSRGAMWIGMGLVGFLSSAATVLVGKVLTIK